MFSDARRRLKIAAALVLILGLGSYYAWIAANLQSGWNWCMDDPAGRDGSTLVFPLWTVTAVGDDRYEISKIVAGVPVIGDPGPLKVGDTVSVVARFDGGREVAVEELRELHTLRRWKEALSVLGFVVMAGAAPVAFRVRDGRIVERTWRT
jgi:hypothetical protein